MCALLALSLCLAAATSAPAPVRIDRVVAVVDREILTESELVRETRIALALRGGPLLARAPLSQEVLQGMLEFLISRALVANQARRLAAPEVGHEEVEAAVLGLRQRFTSAADYQTFLHRYGLTDGQVRDSLRA